MISVFDIFKIGIGPSSSHTMGPMVAAKRFLDEIKNPENIVPGSNGIHRIRVTLYGSLAFTGKGHATDLAIFYGLLGFEPSSFDAEKAQVALAELRIKRSFEHPILGSVQFHTENDLIFDYEQNFEQHANSMVMEAFDKHNQLSGRQAYFSIGGGFVVTEKEFGKSVSANKINVPHSYDSMSQLLNIAAQTNKTIAEIVLENERSVRSRAEVQDGLEKIFQTMLACIDRGLSTEGVLPGGLNVKRRAAKIFNDLNSNYHLNNVAPHIINDWIMVYAMAVNEENAAGGQVVTSPTNGAAGVVPAVLRYYLDHFPGATRSKIPDFLLTASAIGGIIKQNASISGAECGCQAEVGSASAMAAAGLCSLMGGTPMQIENAAEIALEHHLGMTCDPVAGLVQVPCIERNGLGAMKAVSSASLAMRGDGTHFMPLDNCIEAMRQTGRDMDNRYKETSQGGLAVNLPQC